MLPSSVIKAYHGDAEDPTREKRAVYINGRWPNATIPFAFDRDSFSKFCDNVVNTLKIISISSRFPPPNTFSYLSTCQIL